jgi:hypothetical protein
MRNAGLKDKQDCVASHLHDGELCPVCGSLKHPHKGTATGYIPTKVELEWMRKEKASFDKKPRNKSETYYY